MGQGRVITASTRKEEKKKKEEKNTKDSWTKRFAQQAGCERNEALVTLGLG